MRRYRVLAFQFDTRAGILSQEVGDGWPEAVKANWETNKRSIRAELVSEFGEEAAGQKLRNFVDLGSLPISVLAFHNRFLGQVRRAFVIGSYYPALTGATALGERVLNHLVRRLREHYRRTPEYKRVYRKESFDDWGQAVDVLRGWSVLRDEVCDLFKRLGVARHRALHFRPETDVVDRSLALEAICLLQEIVSLQFGAFGPLPWFIPGTRGGSYLKKEVEREPFIREVYLPNCVYVGPDHELGSGESGFFLERDGPYDNEEPISDAEFSSRLNQGHA